jgi:glycosyltransferase involved in cell wall biosynthesis
MSVLFSIIIPTFNRAHLLSSTVQSVLKQEYDHFELLIIDDGSTDQTRDVINHFDDSRIRYFYKENEERAIARNFGIQKASGKYITFLDSDDIVYPNNLSEALKIISSNNQPEWFHLGYEVRDQDGKKLWQVSGRKNNNHKRLITGNHLSCMGVFLRKDIALANAFQEDPELIGSEDYELWLRLSLKYPLYYSHQISGCIVQHQSRSVLNIDRQKLINRIFKLIHLAPEAIKQNRTFVSHRFLYLALHLQLASEKKTSFKYLWDALKMNPRVIFSIKTWAILRLYFL